jgi:hypothetical protein
MNATSGLHGFTPPSRVDVSRTASQQSGRVPLSAWTTVCRLDTWHSSGWTT